MTTTRRSVAVVGAGLAGTTAALGFLDAGFDVTVLSDRDRESLRNDVPATGTAVYFGKSRESDARIIEDLYADGPHSTGMSTRLYSGDGDTRAEVLEFDPDFRYVAQGVDVRLRADDRLGRFLDRGGRFEVRAVTPESLDAIAAEHDLTLVATGKGGLSSLFPVDAERTVYREPQRTLLLVTLRGLGHGPDTWGYRSEAGGAHNLFNLHTEYGEAWLGPYLHKDAGPTWSFLGFAKPGSPWVERFEAVTDVHSARRTVVELYRDYFPQDAPEVEKLEVIEADPHSWLRGAVTPTVRRAVGRTAGGHVVAAIGDTAIAFARMRALHARSRRPHRRPGRTEHRGAGGGAGRGGTRPRGRVHRRLAHGAVRKALGRPRSRRRGGDPVVPRRSEVRRARGVALPRGDRE